jgi:DNA (cytosine-5)-methyltransferase 1
MLSIRELCRLQTFPDDYEIIGTSLSARRQVGNAVPPLVAEVLGIEVRKQWCGQKGSQSLIFYPKRFDKKATKSKVHKVPEKYLFLVGIHRDHPGQGKGPRALLQKAAQASREEPQ